MDHRRCDLGGGENSMPTLTETVVTLFHYRHHAHGEWFIEHFDSIGIPRMLRMNLVSASPDPPGQNTHVRNVPAR